MEEEGVDAATSLHDVLQDQIHGLELDQRCCQIGAFNLALTAWKLGGFQQLPQLNIACCGIAPQAKLADWVKLAGDDEKLRAGMSRLHKLFEQAPVLGSLINPNAGSADLLTAGYAELQPLLDKALLSEKKEREGYEMAVAAKGIAKAAALLAGKFHLVATNVPYLARGKQDHSMKSFLETEYSSSKQDLAFGYFCRRIKNLGKNF
jgi:hypothetical protein